MFHKFALHIYIHKAADYDMAKILHFYKHNPQKKKLTLNNIKTIYLIFIKLTMTHYGICS